LDIGHQLAGFVGAVVLGALVVLVLTGGLPAAWLATQRGRSALDWAFIGILLGPLAVLLVGLAPIQPAGRYGSCTRCSEVIRLTATRCRYCGWEGKGHEPGT
jgi:hypothetical protein